MKRIMRIVSFIFYLLLGIINIIMGLYLINAYMNNEILDNARDNYSKVMNKFNKAGGRFLFYNANDVDNESFKPIVIGLSEEEVETKMNEKIKKNPEKYKKYKFGGCK